jgi:cell wall-associated NlpC family hydrolase
MTPEQRQAVLTEALTWKGTPFRGHSCLKGCGVDCGQLVYGVYRACGLIPEIELPRDYSLQIAQHRASTEYVDIVSQHFREIPEEEVQPGDLVIYKLGLAYGHAALVISWPDYVLQADSIHGEVCGAHGWKDPLFRRNPRKFFTLKEEEAAQ